MIETIGHNAGLIWHALSENEMGLTVKEIKKATKIRTEKDIYAALGWLAKEDKLIFEGEEKEPLVKLK